MIVLGISLGFNSSASLMISNGCKITHLKSLSQEKINGIKNTKELPIEAAATLINVVKVRSLRDIVIAYSHYEKLSYEYIKKNFPHEKFPIDIEKASKIYCTPEKLLLYIFKTALGIDIKEVVRVEHHTAHLYSSYPIYGYINNNIAITADGFGDGVSLRVYKNNKQIFEQGMRNSLGLFYQFVTGALGFKEHQHEGKITGIATANLPVNRAIIKKYMDFFESIFYFDDKLVTLDEHDKRLVEESNIIDFDIFLRLKKTIYSYVKNELPSNYNSKNIIVFENAVCMAIAVHEFVQNRMLNLVDLALRNYDDKLYKYCFNGVLYLSGGLFANVAINRVIGRRFSKCFIMPAMGDEGTAIGAAAFYTFIKTKQTKKYQNIELYDMFDGFYPDRIIDAGIGNNDVSADNVATCIVEGDFVHIVDGCNEFGPRALMHRSTLFSAKSLDKSQELNESMNRNEFMPFAPVCRAERVHEILAKDYYKFEESLHFMTVALYANKLNNIEKMYPAAVHKDGTCRIQVVHKDVPCERKAWEILKKYEEMTGEIMLINTSFNIHNSPTVCTNEQADIAYEMSCELGILIK